MVATFAAGVVGARPHMAGAAVVGIAVTIVGAWLPWSFDGPVRLGGLEGSHDGWLAVLSAAAAIATVRGLRRGSWPPMVIAFICGAAALYFVLRDRPPPDSHLGWGWFVTLIGTLGMVAAARRLDRRPPARRAGIEMGPAAVLVAANRGRGCPDRPVAVRVPDLLAGGVRHRGGQLATARRRDHRRRRAGSTEEFVSGSPRPVTSISTTCGPPRRGRTVRGGGRVLPRIVEDIQSATESVHILMFGWDSSEIGTQFAGVLKQKPPKVSRCESPSTTRVRIPTATTRTCTATSCAPAPRSSPTTRSSSTSTGSS